MSIHKSKGLEFPVVFLCGLSRSFNQENAREQVLCDKDLGLGLSCIDMKNRVRYPNIAKRAISRKIQSDSISEEMRVLYVAMTRAKDRLIMTYAAKNLENDLNDIILRSRFSGKVLLTKEVHSPGEWILQTALKRTEAGSLFQLAGNRQETAVSQIPWKICVIESSQAMESIDCAEHEASLVGDEVLIRLRDSLQYHYPHISASNTPSKLTATQLKGRFKDAEAAENTDQTRQKYRAFRKPSFVATQVSGKDIGNAIHAVMQYISYSACTDELSIRKELDRLVDERFISPSHRELANTRKIWSLFSSPLGIRMRTCEEVLREFKFSILDRSEKYAPETIGEEVLLQGVVDCALIEPDGIIVIDFKTDYVTESTLDEVCRQYSPQVKVYAEALGRIFEKPIQNVMLYFFHLDRFVEITV